MEVLRIFKKIHPKAKALYMSRYNGDILFKHRISEQEMNFIQNPVSTLHLARKVREVLDGNLDEVDHISRKCFL